MPEIRLPLHIKRCIAAADRRTVFVKFSKRGVKFYLHFPFFWNIKNRFAEIIINIHISYITLDNCVVKINFHFAKVIFQNVPYGNLPQDELKKKVERIFSGISALKPAAAVVACNTVTARCIKSLRADYSFPIVGIQPAVKEAVKTGGKCIVFATPATATSSSLKKLIDAYGNAQTEVVACPKFAAFVERNIFNLDEEELINLLPDVTADAVVLGCTHYI